MRPTHATAMMLPLLLVAACRSGDPKQPPAPPTATVAVTTVTPQSTEEPLDFVGQVEASRTVQVRAQATGVITARPFREGAQVRAGDVLYRIDATNYDADLRGARARVTEAESRLQNATVNAARLRPLIADNAVARQDVDNAEATLQQSRASLDDARATLARAQKSVSETVVRAEISGRVGRALLDVGTRVAGPSDVLTTIDIIDPVYVSFRPSAEQQYQWKRDPASQHAVEPGGAARVQAVLPDGSPYPVLGRIGFVDPVVDAATGTQRFRAEFPGKDRLLVPGQFVRVKLLGLVRTGAILIPQRAVMQQMGRQSVYVVDAKSRVQARDVKATGWSGENWLIESGLAAGDRVVVDGLQKIGPGAPVRATEAVGDSATRSPVAAATGKAGA